MTTADSVMMLELVVTEEVEDGAVGSSGFTEGHFFLSIGCLVVSEWVLVERVKTAELEEGFPVVLTTLLGMEVTKLTTGHFR